MKILIKNLLPTIAIMSLSLSSVNASHFDVDLNDEAVQSYCKNSAIREAISGMMSHMEAGGIMGTPIPMDFENANFSAIAKLIGTPHENEDGDLLETHEVTVTVHFRKQKRYGSAIELKEGFNITMADKGALSCFYVSSEQAGDPLNH